MCLTLTEKSGIKVAKEDIICYKVMNKLNNILLSPYQNMQYKCGIMYVSKNSITVKHIFAIGACVEEGFHSVSNEQEAERLKSALQTFAMLCNVDTQYVVVKCLIPAGTRYAVGFFSERGESFDSLCSEQIKIIAIKEV